jgi:hypothetical protein
MLDDIPCEYVPLSEYKWHPASYVPWDTCPTRYPWNPIIYTVIASFQACTFCIAIELTGQVFARFRRKHSLYFWYAHPFLTMTFLASAGETNNRLTTCAGASS